MVSKHFEQTIRFRQARKPNGDPVWYPIVEAILLTPIGSRIALPLLFDTGADFTTFRADLYHFLGLSSWDQGTPVSTGTGGGITTCYEYRADLEVFGKTINCPIHLNQTLQPNPLFCGLLGRYLIFEQFGFGFWESTHELYVTATP
jgi:hypothetical protein